MPLRNRQWLLKTRPSGPVSAADFEYGEETAGHELQPGQILVRNLIFGLAPTMRNMMNDPMRSYRAAVEIGSPIIGPAAARIVKSSNPNYPAGTNITAVTRWEDYSVLDPDASPMPIIRIPPTISAAGAMGVYGMNSLAAYVGLLKIGDPKPGETVVVSAAAGSVGSMAVQIAKIRGCYAVGIAGGQAKCEWLRDACGVDAIDYTSEDLQHRLGVLCPRGVDVFFDNVGGAIMQAVIDNIAVHGRIVLCGQISAYDSGKPAPGPSDMMRIVYQRVRIQGFVLGDFCNEIESAQADLMRWVKAEQIVHREDLRQGFELLPGSFLDLFSGRNQGTLLVQIADST
jgi:NADPH-dependent curcumin reductase CurA